MTRNLELAALVRAAHRRIATRRIEREWGTPMSVILKKEGWLA